MANNSPCSIATVSGLGLDEINSDTLPTVPGAASTSPDLEANLTLGVQLPRRSYDLEHHVQRYQGSPRAYDQPVGALETSVAADVIPEQDVGVRNDAAYTEEGPDISLGLVD